MVLLFARRQRHHETLHPLAFQIERLDLWPENRQDAVLLGLGFHRREQRPGQHITALGQRCIRAVGPMHTGTLTQGNAADGRIQFDLRRSQSHAAYQ